MAANDHVDMVCHDAPGIYFQSLFVNTVFPAIEDYVVIFFPGKYVNPLHHGVACKIKAALVMEFILPAHSRQNNKFACTFLPFVADATPFSSTRMTLALLGDLQENWNGDLGYVQTSEYRNWAIIKDEYDTKYLLLQVLPPKI